MEKKINIRGLECQRLLKAGSLCCKLLINLGSLFTAVQIEVRSAGQDRPQITDFPPLATTQLMKRRRTGVSV